MRLKICYYGFWGRWFRIWHRILIIFILSFCNASIELLYLLSYHIISLLYICVFTVTSYTKNGSRINTFILLRGFKFGFWLYIEYYIQNEKSIIICMVWLNAIKVTKIWQWVLEVPLEGRILIKHTKCLDFCSMKRLELRQFNSLDRCFLDFKCIFRWVKQFNQTILWEFWIFLQSKNYQYLHGLWMFE